MSDISKTGKCKNLFTQEDYIDATQNIENTFGTDMNLDGVYYCDFYSLPTLENQTGDLDVVFKQSENRELIWQTADESKKL